MRVLVAAVLVMATLTPVRAANAAACTAEIGPGIPPPASLPAKLPGFHAAWHGQSGYMRLCQGDTATATLAYYNSGSLGWVAGRAGQVAYLGTWSSEPGQDQPSILGGDGQLGSPATGWPRFNRIAVQPASYVGPGQVAWFQFTVRAPTTPGTYRLYVRPLIEGATWLEDIGVFWQIVVLNPDGSVPPATPPDPVGVSFRIDPGVNAKDIALVHQGVQRASGFLDRFVGGARRTPSTVHVYVGDGTQSFCCLTFGDSFEIVTSHRAWSAPAAAAPDTWTADTERTELAAHEYVHLWQYAVGGNACMVGPRWIAEGMAESFAYRSLVADRIIPPANLDTFTRRQLTTAPNKATLASLETAWPPNANPFAVAYLAVDRLLAAKGLVAIRDWCARVGSGQEWRAAFAAAFGETTDAFYPRFEAFRAAYLR
ncbi:MAG TPA: hypothetical protein VGR87_07365 [Candidatus Limnocylindria bacterium]|jgi:hypothetical protein|nr:hypothetical protein [Candidatus Limnocylindria bacterium]